jgi:hypothetical protein
VVGVAVVAAVGMPVGVAGAVAVVVAVGMPVGVAGAVAGAVAVGVALRMSVGMVGVEVPACGRRGAGGADANLTERPRTVLASFGAGAAPASGRKRKS